jgi:hypothetical protein
MIAAGQHAAHALVQQDRQTPHNEDEIYSVLSGGAQVKVTAEKQPELGIPRFKPVR